MTTNLATPALDALAARLEGSLLTPESDGYAATVASFNAAVTHEAPYVVAAECAEDVRVAVEFAATNGLSVGVQATGHGAHYPVRDGMLIITSALAQITVDAAARTVTVGAGVRWRDVVAVTAHHGLVPPVGSSTGVGAVGYALGGGIPLMGRTVGFAADHIVELQVVTADGALRRVDRERDPDLFWGLRGGKHNLGLVTEMTIGLIPLDQIFGGGVFYDAAHIPAVLHAYRAWTASLPEQLSSSVAILRLPPVPAVPEPLRGRTVAHLRVCFMGSEEEGQALVAPMLEAAPPLVPMLGMLPAGALDAVHQDPTEPMPGWGRGGLLRDLPADAVDTLVQAVAPDQPSPVMMCEIRHLGGALSRPADNAVNGRDAAYSLYVVGVLIPEVAELVPGAVSGIVQAMEPWSTGTTTLNLHGVPLDREDKLRAFGTHGPRLTALKQRWDPHHLFRHEHSVGADADSNAD